MAGLFLWAHCDSRGKSHVKQLSPFLSHNSALDLSHETGPTREKRGGKQRPRMGPKRRKRRFPWDGSHPSLRRVSASFSTKCWERACKWSLPFGIQRKSRIRWVLLISPFFRHMPSEHCQRCRKTSSPLPQCPLLIFGISWCPSDRSSQLTHVLAVFWTAKVRTVEKSKPGVGK